MNTSSSRLARLEEEEGRPLSDWRIAALLDCTKKQVRRLRERPDEDVRPAYVLTIEYARVVGLDGCQSILEQRPDEFKEVLERITLEVQEVARMLGIDTSTLYRYTLPDRTLDVPRHHFLAALYLDHLYGRGAMPAEVAGHVDVFTEAK
jgi:hypothetical protein